MKLFKRLLPTLALFGSFSTLICCALPTLLVSIGAGAALAGLVAGFPKLIWLSEHKIALFIFSGAMLALSASSQYMARNAPCPVDPVEAGACLSLRRRSLSVLLFSIAVYAVGFFFAFLAIYLL